MNSGEWRFAGELDDGSYKERLEGLGFSRDIEKQGERRIRGRRRKKN